MFDGHVLEDHHRLVLWRSGDQGVWCRMAVIDRQGTGGFDARPFWTRSKKGSLETLAAAISNRKALSSSNGLLTIVAETKVVIGTPSRVCG